MLITLSSIFVREVLSFATWELSSVSSNTKGNLIPEETSKLGLLGGLKSLAVTHSSPPALTAGVKDTL